MSHFPTDDKLFMPETHENIEPDSPNKSLRLKLRRQPTFQDRDIYLGNISMDGKKRIWESWARRSYANPSNQKFHDRSPKTTKYSKPNSVLHLDETVKVSNNERMEPGEDYFSEEDDHLYQRFIEQKMMRSLRQCQKQLLTLLLWTGHCILALIPPYLGIEQIINLTVSFLITFSFLLIM